jgi:hypothetical protein
LDELSKDFGELEREIKDLKQELDRLWHERYSAAMRGNDEELWKARFELAETALKNCSAIASYVRKISDSTANEIEEKVKMASQNLRDGRKTGTDLDSLHAWYKVELAPLLNKVEQEGHLVSEMRKKKQLSA